MCTYQSLFRKNEKLRDPTCDVLFLSTNIQDGVRQNISRNKAEVKILLKTSIYCFGL